VLEFVPVSPRTIGGQLIPGEVKLTLEIGLSRNGQALPALDRQVSEAVGRTDMDEARAATLEAAVQTWAVAYGLAMLDALAQAPDAPSLASVGIEAPAQQVGPFMAWGAHPVLRSTSGPVDAKTTSKFGPSVVSLLAGLTPFTEDIDPGTVHSIEVRARLNTADAPCSVLPSMSQAMSGQTVKSMPLAGEVLVDGQPGGDICELVESVNWPRPGSGSALLWDQYVVLAPSAPDPTLAAE
jgi:hypothetical protein